MLPKCVPKCPQEASKSLIFGASARLLRYHATSSKNVFLDTFPWHFPIPRCCEKYLQVWCSACMLLLLNLLHRRTKCETYIRKYYWALRSFIIDMILVSYLFISIALLLFLCMLDTCCFPTYTLLKKYGNVMGGLSLKNTMKNTLCNYISELIAEKTHDNSTGTRAAEQKDVLLNKKMNKIHFADEHPYFHVYNMHCRKRSSLRECNPKNVHHWACYFPLFDWMDWETYTMYTAQWCKDVVINVYMMC